MPDITDKRPLPPPLPDHLEPFRPIEPPPEVIAATSKDAAPAQELPPGAVIYDTMYSLDLAAARSFYEQLGRICDGAKGKKPEELNAAERFVLCFAAGVPVTREIDGQGYKLTLVNAAIGVTDKGQLFAAFNKEAK